MEPFRYVAGERRPVEILVFEVDPDHVGEWLTVDHEIWTLGECAVPGLDGIPFVSKEVWLDDGRPGEVWVVIEWPDPDTWERVDRPDVQRRLRDAFRERFPHRSELVRAIHEERDRRLHRWSRFEPAGPPTPDGSGTPPTDRPSTDRPSTDRPSTPGSPAPT